MPNSYSQLHVHVVLAPHYRQALIDPSWSEDLHRYLTGILHGAGGKMIRVNAMSDHLHALMGLRPSIRPSDLMRDLKSDTSKWINDHRLCPRTFRWQEGYGMFAVSKRDLDRVTEYIIGQQVHHRKRSFLEEYRELLEEEGIGFDDRYLFYEPV